MFVGVPIILAARSLSLKHRHKVEDTKADKLLQAPLASG